MHRPGMISIWFFIGVLLLAYGILILGSGIYELSNPPEHPVVLAESPRRNLVGRAAHRSRPHLHPEIQAPEGQLA